MKKCAVEILVLFNNYVRVIYNDILVSDKADPTNQIFSY